MNSKQSKLEALQDKVNNFFASRALYAEQANHINISKKYASHFNSIDKFNE